MSRFFESFLVYTTTVGGKLHVRWANVEDYERAKQSGRIHEYSDSLDDYREVEIKMVAFGRCEDLRDFALEPVGT